MLNKLKEQIKKNDRLYVWAKCIKHANSPELIDLLRGYCDLHYDRASTIIIEHRGEKLPDRVIYDISFGVEEPCVMGFAALLYHSLYCLKFSETIGAIPNLIWGRKTMYYDRQMDNETDNVFEYYFKPISDVSKYSLDEYKNVVKSNRRHTDIFHNMYETVYLVNDNDISLLAEQYKHNIKLNNRTADFIQESITLISNKTLGVHARGTDFALGFERHPKMVTIEEYLSKTKEMFSSGRYDKVFLATEDENILMAFKNEFGMQLVYYTDVFRTLGDRGPHSTPDNRPLHYYKLGLEVLRDIYTLANCDGLIANLSNVSNAARYVNLALEKKYSEIAILDKGLNKIKA